MEILSPDKWRAKFGVILPEANAAIEADFWRMAPRGITFHSGRVALGTGPAAWDPKDAAEGQKLAAAVRAQIHTVDGQQVYADSVRSLLSLKPDRIIFPLSLVSMQNGVAGADAMLQNFEKWSGGVGVTLGAHAVRAALDAFGAKRIGLLSPYGTDGQDAVISYLVEAGYEVVRAHTLQHAGADAILQSSNPEGLRPLIDDLDGPDIDVIFQSGANMTILGLVDQTEQRIGKPVLAMNALVLWAAMRASGFDDRLDGFGALWRER